MGKQNIERLTGKLMKSTIIDIASYHGITATRCASRRSA